MRESFERWFERLTGNEPLPFQRRLAESERLHRLLRIPTGLGKTEALLAGWLWRRRFSEESTRRLTPRRLVYCLPMRVLVEQTSEVARQMLARAGLADAVQVHVVMGGEAAGEWEARPEDDAILVGTQDMLLSRALNRGYAMSRYRWPIHFALLNDDALWVVDEPQLFGAGLPTTTQLAAFRRCFGTFGPTGTIWASATLDPAWLRTVDVVPERDLFPELVLGSEDLAHPVVRRRLGASKQVVRTEATIGDLTGLASLVRREHRPGTRTIAVVNTVARARDLHAYLVSGTVSGKGRGRRTGQVSESEAADGPRVVLMHSRFRPEDRKRRIAEALTDPSGPGTIVVSTQVIEAGVDVSSQTLVTELAPWASVVQRLGRCNRKGDELEARVFWCGLPTKEKDRRDAAAPYELADLERAEQAMSALTEGSPEALQALGLGLDAPPPVQVIRSRDLVELFDTTPDLSGADVDISRFIREGDDRSVHVFWREFDGVPDASIVPVRGELCPCPLGELRDFLYRTNAEAWRWDLLGSGLRGRWEMVGAGSIFAGLEVLLRSTAGGYTPGNLALRGRKTAAPLKLRRRQGIAARISVAAERVGSSSSSRRGSDVA